MKPEAPPRLKLVGVSKSFPGVRANDNVNLSVRPGEIHALLGENGAGKSTLVKMIYGILAPDEGQILFDGAPAGVSNPRAARRLGIGMVFQHFSLFEAMTVLENIALGLDSRLSSRELLAQFNKVLDAYQLKLDPRRVVSTLSVGERQRIEIVRALLLNPRLLIMDEPTSVLTPQEVEQLFETLKQLASSGCSILYISHKLHEIVALCDTATILRGGKVVATCDPRRETSRSMAELMIGANLREIAKPAGRVFGPPKLEAQGLTLPKPTEFGVALRDVTLTVRAGEIFGVAGVAGNGQNELLSAMSGETLAPSPGDVLLGGEAVGRLGVTERRNLGLCAVPEERHGHAAVSEFSLTDNASLTGRDRMEFVRFGLIDPEKATNYAAEVTGAFTVKATGPNALAGSLSGGNLQKFIMGREILQRPEALVVCQPTWGVDAGAAVAIHQAIVDLAARGSAVLVISQDLDELLTLCDTLAVVNLGRLSKPMKVGEASIEEIGLLMGGVHGDPSATIETGRQEKTMGLITRRNFMQTAAAGLAMPALLRRARAAEPLKVGFVYLGPIGDYGWTWAHEKGRKAMVDALKGQVVADYVENVKEDASATPVIKDLAQQGHKLIFATTFGYMDQTVEAAKQFPDVKFEHCTGYKHADNLGAYNSRFHQGRAVEGAIAGMMTKSNTIGYLGSYKVPEVVLGVNAFTLAAQAVNPNVTTKLIMIDSWFDPAKEAAAVQTLANLGCDVVSQHTDSPAGLQVCEQRKVWCFGNAADMSRFAPKTHLTAIEDIWGPYYISRAKAVLDGTWKPDDAWWGMKESAVVMAPYNKAMPDAVKAAADKIIAGWKDGSYDVFTGPISDQSGKERLVRGERMKDADLAVIDWYVKGVQSS